ncbi:MAG: TonB family protein [Prevotellaceae bacterium]|jgi:TonB family protein|nr:TonB family protein [Prevotellaceae bacterium]
MKHLLLLLICLPCLTFGSTRIYLNKNKKPCKERRAHFYRDVEKLPNGKLRVTTYKVDSSLKISAGVYTAIEPHEIIDTLWEYDEEGWLKSKEIYKGYDYKNSRNKRSEVELYYPGGQVKSLLKHGERSTQTTRWHPNGALRYKHLQVERSLEGEVVSYHPNGQLKSKEIYVRGRLAEKGERYDSLGNAVEFYPLVQYACFDGVSCKNIDEGANSFRYYVASRLHYPKDAAKEKAEGRAIVQFSVGEEGKVENVKLLRSAGHPSLDYEAIAAVGLSPTWRPMSVDDEALQVLYTIPVIFKLR